MKFYFDSNMARVELPEEGMVIFYSSYLHNLLKVDTIAASIFDYIVHKGVGQEIGCEEVADTILEVEPDDVKEIFGELCSTGLFFDKNVRSVVSNDTIKETNEVKKYFSKYNINHIGSIYIPNTPDEICKVPLDIEPEIVDEHSGLQDIGRCGACFNVLAIDPSGKIYPCQSLMKDGFSLGNVKEKNWLSTVRNHNLTKYFLYRTIEKIDGCRDCEVRTICGGGWMSCYFLSDL